MSAVPLLALCALGVCAVAGQDKVPAVFVTAYSGLDKPLVPVYSVDDTLLAAPAVQVYDPAVYGQAVSGPAPAFQPAVAAAFPTAPTARDFPAAPAVRAAPTPAAVRTTPATARTIPATARTTPSAARTSPPAARTSPSTTRTSPSTARTSPSTARTTPTAAPATPAADNSSAWLRAARAPAPKREKLVFAEEFNKLDPAVWTHLVTGWRGGNKEFQYYRNDRRNSYVRGGVLYLRPTLTAAEFGDAFLYTGKLYYPDCNFKPCVSESGADIVLPIQSARINTRGAFSFRYGRLEVRAKLPRGDWIWPAIWLKPASNAYGRWPASGEMDLVESRGNANLKNVRTGETLGVQKIGATLHFGPNSSYNIWRLSHWEKILERGDFADDFHVFGMEWSPEGFRFTVDKEEIGSMAVPAGGFWDLGGFDKDPGGPNIWANGTELAPFDRKFFIILNVAVGGTFFPNGMVNQPYPRPWNWTSGHPLREFWEHRHWWLPTWKGEHAAMQVDYVRVYQNVP